MMDDNKISYYDYLKGKRHLKGTIRLYKSLISDYASTLIIAVEDAKYTVVIKYMNAFIRNKKISNRKKGRFINAFDEFYNGLHNKKYVMLFKIPKFIELKYPVIFTYPQIEIIFKNTLNMKFKIIFGFMYLMGLKPNEVIFLKLENYNSRNRTIKLFNKKGIATRTLHVPESLAILIYIYRKRKEPQNYMFVGRDKKKYNERTAERYFTKVLKESNINIEASLETLRSSYIAHQLQCGMDKNALKYLTGLKSLRSINAYLQDYFDADNINIFTNGEDLLYHNEDRD